ncbi:cyclin-dependent kinase inhibitor 3-like isoform X2 [Pocillopora verrucosa]|uniref:cyclin-dependent kinase inhibitor 3-like isoform X2 n=1 Tax=Pocillopora verrucosa TaxID=203993 RepID=UPI003340E8B0
MVLQRSSVRRHDFDSSDDDEDNIGDEDLSPFQVDWIDLSFTGCCAEIVGISGLPGCKYRETNRNLAVDMNEYSWAGFEVHHFPVDAGGVPTLDECNSMIKQLRQCISFGRKTILHCVSGLGISCLVAAILLLSLDETLSPDHAISKLRQIRGQRAFQTIKEYNFVLEFRDLHKAHVENQQNSAEAAPRSLSR